MSLGLKPKKWCPCGEGFVLLGVVLMSGGMMCLAIWKAVELTGRFYGWILGLVR